MSEDLDTPPTSRNDTVLRLLVLGVIYTVAVFFVVALSPSMGFMSPPSAGDTGSVAAAPESRAR